MKIKSIYIHPDKETLKVEGREFVYFTLYDEKGNDVEQFDYFDIECEVRVDIEKINNKKVIRIFPRYAGEYFVYDELTHTLKSRKERL